MSSENNLSIIADVSSDIIKYANDELSGISSELCTSISNEIDNRSLNDAYISGKVDILSSQFIDHIAENNSRFTEEYARMLSTVLHDKHYQIYDDLTLSKPYKLHDFSINIINDIIDNAVVEYAGNKIGSANIDGEKIKI